jgi:hypothetical protein
MSTLALSRRLSGVPAIAFNGVLFNLSWFAILVSQSTVLAVAIAGLHLVTHFIFLGKGRRELLLIVAVTLVGAVLDQLLFLSGVCNLGGERTLAPLWLACLWPVFATTLMHAFAGLQHRPWLAAAVGAVGGALAYIAGVRLTDVEFGSPLWGPVIIGLAWSALFPLFLGCASRLQGVGDPLQSWEPAVRRAFD